MRQNDIHPAAGCEYRPARLERHRTRVRHLHKMYVNLGIELLSRKLFFYLRGHVVTLFVQDYAKTTQSIFTKFGGKITHGLWNDPLDFGGNPDHVTSGLWYG